MKNKILIVALAAVILITLAGCGSQMVEQKPVQTVVEASSVSIASDTEKSDDATAEKSSPAVDSEITAEKDAIVSQSENSATDSKPNSAKPFESQTQDKEKIQFKPPKSREIPSKSTQAVTEKSVQATSAVQKSVQTTAQKEIISKAADPTEKPMTTKSAETQFDINYWISYAKSYAGSVGLRLESSAVDCWDNPISANAKCKYLERDIKSRLNFYAKAEDITDVWIWAEKVADNLYEIYIGYA